MSRHVIEAIANGCDRVGELECKSGNHVWAIQRILMLD